MVDTACLTETPVLRRLVRGSAAKANRPEGLGSSAWTGQLSGIGTVPQDVPQISLFFVLARASRFSDAKG